MLVFANFAGGEGDTACRPSGTLPQTPRVFAQIGAPSSSPGPRAGGAVPVSADRTHVSPVRGAGNASECRNCRGLPALLEPSNSRTHWGITFYRRPLHLGVAPVPADKPHVSLRRPGRWRRIKVPKPPEPVPHHWEGWGAVSRRNRGGRTYTASWQGLCGSPEPLKQTPRRRKYQTLPGGLGMPSASL